MLTLLANVAIVIVALSHAGFLVLEMFLWERPIGRRIFGTTPEQAKLSAPLAANQGLYNGFLAAGLVWGVLSGSFELKVFFLVCVAIAGIYGGMTAKRSIVFVQALPALVALALVYAAR